MGLRQAAITATNHINHILICRLTGSPPGSSAPRPLIHGQRPSPAPRNASAIPASPMPAPSSSARLPRTLDRAKSPRRLFCREGAKSWGEQPPGPCGHQLWGDPLHCPALRPAPCTFSMYLASTMEASHTVVPRLDELGSWARWKSMLRGVGIDGRGPNAVGFGAQIGDGCKPEACRLHPGTTNRTSAHPKSSCSTVVLKCVFQRSNMVPKKEGAPAGGGMPGDGGAAARGGAPQERP
jgi:hypothetical protein